jgi:hypothetical protein
MYSKSGLLSLYLGPYVSSVHMATQKVHWRITQLQYLLLNYVNRVLRSSTSNFLELRKREVRRIPLLSTSVNKGPGDGVREASVPHNQPVDSGELLPVLGRPAIDSGTGPKRLQARD